MTKSWYKKRDIAHWLLFQLITKKFEIVKDDVKLKLLPNGGTTLDDATGRDVYWYQYLPHNLRKVTKLTSKYTIKEINDAKDVLLINKHIEITSSNEKDVYDVSFKTNNEGRIAYEDKYYVIQKSEQWYRDITNVSNWLTPALTLLVSVVALVIAISQCQTKNKENNTTNIIRSRIPTKAINGNLNTNHQLDSMHLKDS